MGLWKRVEERLFTGQVLQDYGLISDTKAGVASRKVKVLLTTRDNATRFVIRTSYKAFLSASVQFLELDREAVVKLRTALDDALARMP
jgi:predicted HAD superfamily phosphohydrolase